MTNFKGDDSTICYIFLLISVKVIARMQWVRKLLVYIPLCNLNPQRVPDSSKKMRKISNTKMRQLSLKKCAK